MSKIKRLMKLIYVNLMSLEIYDAISKIKRPSKINLYKSDEFFSHYVSIVTKFID